MKCPDFLFYNMKEKMNQISCKIAEHLYRSGTVRCSLVRHRQVVIRDKISDSLVCLPSSPSRCIRHDANRISTLYNYRHIALFISSIVVI